MAEKIFFETIRSEGLAHMSYIFGSGKECAVVDPRRDCEIYVDIAQRNGAVITHIFETHRNEDYVIGSIDLARRTGAAIYHGEALDFHYGTSVREGNIFKFEDLVVTVLETPGHTYESISLTLTDKNFGNEPIAVFTGDTLFIGDVGRTDFFPDCPEEVAGLLYDSLFRKLLPLGDHVLLFPAHGAGSVCGSGMAAREFSTLGFERKHNPLLQLTERDQFIKHKVHEHHYKPPYFKQMEHYNQEGNAPPVYEISKPPPVGPAEFSDAMKKGMLALDARSPEAIAGAFIPGSLALPLDMIPAFAGWFLPYDRPLGLVVHKYSDVETAVRFLLRLGYDKVTCFLNEGLYAWEVGGHKYDRIPAIHAQELTQRIQEKERFTLLDVRTIEEFQKGHLPNAHHIYVGELPDRLDQIPRNQRITTFCGSGRRAIIAASILKNHGFDVVEDSLGSMAACSAIGCPVVTG